MSKQNTSVARQGNSAAARPKSQADLNADELRHYLKKMEGDLTDALRGQVPIDWFTRVAITTYRTGGKGSLIECTPLSFVAALFEGAQLGLSPDAHQGEFWIIPRNTKISTKVDGRWVDSWVKMATFQIGVQGLVKLARRSGEVASIQPFPVYKGDEFSIRFGTEDSRIIHVPSMEATRTDENLIATYAVARLRSKSGEETKVFDWMPRSDIEASADRSGGKNGRSDVWNKHYTSMAQVRVVGRLCKWLPRTDELAMALARDSTREDGEEPQPIITIESTPSATGYAQSNGGLDALVPGGDDRQPEYDYANGEVSPDELPEDLEGRSP